jgi:hypothetical protein
MTHLINEVCNAMASFANAYLFTFMFVGFFAALLLKGVVHYMMRAQFNFAKEFEKRVHRYLDKEMSIEQGDYEKVLANIMEKTWVETYELRWKNMRRKLDRVASLTDRLFLIEDGAKRLIRDTLKEAKYARLNQDVNHAGTARFVLSINPYFNNLFGVIPLRTANNLLAILPGLFIIGGIFGTFLGITAGIPQLKGMDPTNAEVAKSTMGFFLDNMAFSLNTSVVGILFSVCLTVINSVFSSKQLHNECVHKLVHGLELVWRETLHNQTNPSEAFTEEAPAEEVPPLPMKIA